MIAFYNSRETGTGQQANVQSEDAQMEQLEAAIGRTTFFLQSQ
jgi:hypothetical protein